MTADDQTLSLRRRDVRRRFDRAAAGFEGAEFVHGTAREGLLARLEPMQVDARVILDTGAGIGGASAALARRFGGARVIAVDLSIAMLRRLRRDAAWFSAPPAVQADACRLPFAEATADIIFANLLLPWIDDPAQFFREAARVLRKEGLLVFSTLGPDSLLSLRRAWQQADAGEGGHVHRFLDMHDIGDAAVRSGLRDPVLDVDRLTVTYASAADLFRDLTAVGARNCLAARRATLTGRRRFEAMRSALEASAAAAPIAVGLELVYGHCWGAGAAADRGEFRVDAGHIPRRG